MPPPPPVARPSRPGTSPWGRTRTPCRRPSVGRPGPRRPPSPGDRRPSLIPPFNARGDSCSSKGACSRISAFPDTGRNPCPRVPYGPSGTFDASLTWTLPHMAPSWHCASPVWMHRTSSTGTRIRSGAPLSLSSGRPPPSTHAGVAKPAGPPPPPSAAAAAAQETGQRPGSPRIGVDGRGGGAHSHASEAIPFSPPMPRQPSACNDGPGGRPAEAGPGDSPLIVSSLDPFSMMWPRPPRADGRGPGGGPDVGAAAEAVPDREHPARQLRPRRPTRRVPSPCFCGWVAVP